MIFSCIFYMYVLPTFSKIFDKLLLIDYKPNNATNKSKISQLIKLNRLMTNLSV